MRLSLFIVTMMALTILSFAVCDFECGPSGNPNACYACQQANGGSGGLTGPGAPDLSQITVALTNLCQTVKNILGVGMMLMVVSAAAVYSIGQIMGAETRARASVWATSMFNGAIIAALIYLLVPYVLNQMLAGKVNVQCFFLF